MLVSYLDDTKLGGMANILDLKKTGYKTILINEDDDL